MGYVFPTCLRLDNYKDIVDKDNTSIKREKNVSQIAIIGSKCGRVHAHYILDGDETRFQKGEEGWKDMAPLLFRTQGGLLYGEVSAISSKNSDGDHITVASSSGELLNFEYKNAML